MENPFEVLNQKLDKLTGLLEDITWRLNEPKKAAGKQVMNITEAAELMGLARQTLYSYTSKRMIPHYKTGKRIHFLLDELLDWITNTKVKTVKEIELEASLYKTRRK